MKAATTRTEASASASKRRGLAIQVRRDVEREFYKWKSRDAAETFLSLALALEANSISQPESEDDYVLDDLADSLSQSARIEDTAGGPSQNPTSAASSMTLRVWVPGSNAVKEQISRFPVYHCDPVEPVPPYSDWRPVKHNIFPGTGGQFETLSFIPYADQPAFPANDYVECYHKIEGERDPDMDVIELDIASRLVFDHNFSFEEVDETDVLKYRMQDESEASDLISLLYSRDFPDWPASALKRHPSLLTKAKRPSTELGPRVTELVSYFCPVLKCSHFLCSQHVNIGIRLNTQAPVVSCEGELASNVDPCSSTCYKTYHQLKPLRSDWSPKELEELGFILQLTPDCSPCDLAVMVEKPCFKVHNAKWSILPKESVSGDVNRRTTIPPNIRGKLHRRFVVKCPDMAAVGDASDIRSFAYWDPCQHDGNCSSHDCECVKRDLHCQRGCSCSLTCERRFVGCKCAVNSRRGSRKICRTDRCPCFAAKRECMPDLCVHCGAGGTDAFDCSNCVLQLQNKKKISVRPSAHGWGAFIEENVKPGDFIAEYVGEIIDEDTGRVRDFISMFLKRNYRFQLNDVWTVDASVDGNETRFINHSKWKANAEACIRVYDGDHGVGIFATQNIKAGEEIFLNYGDEFFPEGQDHGQVLSVRK